MLRKWNKHVEGQEEREGNVERKGKKNKTEMYELNNGERGGERKVERKTRKKKLRKGGRKKRGIKEGRRNTGRSNQERGWN